MKRAALLALFALAGCAQSRDQVPREGAAVEEPGADAGRQAVAAAAPAPAAPPDPFAGVHGEAGLGFAAEAALFSEPVPALLEVPALELACLARGDALARPGPADARLDVLAEEQAARLGRLRFVRFESDPGATPMRTVPRLCRVVNGDAALYAPLFRVREPPARWLIEPMEREDVSAALASLLRRAADEGVAPAGPPRVVLVRERAVAAALPVAARGGAPTGP